jgi:hypothetical protein
MVLSNAERQALYRSRLKKRASLDALGEQARRAADRAVEALWSFYSRPAPDGAQWGELDGVADLAALRAMLSEASELELTGWCRESLDGAEEEGATPEEIAAWRAVVEAADALALKHAAP